PLHPPPPPPPPPFPSTTLFRSRLGRADDDEPALRRSQHLDGGAVEARQRLGRDHLGRRPGDRLPAREVDDPVEVAEQGVDVVREDRKSTRLNSSHQIISYAVFR